MYGARVAGARSDVAFRQPLCEVAMWRLIRSVWSRGESAKTRFRYSCYLEDLLTSGDLPDARRVAILRELRLRQDTRTTVTLILLTVILAAITAAVAQLRCSPPDTTGADASTQPASRPSGEPPRHESGGPALAVLWAVGVFGGGALVGFLFGIPRSAQAAMPGEGDTKGRRGHSLTPNTNLEQISDWLTKILVGLGLVEARSIFDGLWRLSAFMSAGHGLCAPPLAAAILLTFSVLGFFMGYLATRMFLTQVFGLADGGMNLGEMPDAPAVLDTNVAPSDVTDDGSLRIDETVRSQARAVVSASSPPRLTDPFEARYKRAKSLLLLEKYAKAATEYASLVADRPNDAKLRCERLWALFKRGPKWSPEIAGTLQALEEQRRAATDPTQVYLSLTFHYLYAGTAEAANKVVALATEYERLQQRPTAGIYINLACAYGALAEDVAPDSQAFTEYAVRASEAIDKALALKPSVLGRIQRLAGEDSDENDLAIFRETKAFQDVLARAASRAEPRTAPDLESPRDA